MTIQDIVFSPLIPWPVLTVLAVFAILPALFALAQGLRGGLFRLGIALLLITLAAGPSLLQEQREKLNDIALLAIDQSPSQTLADRTERTQTLHKELKNRLKTLPHLEVREVFFSKGQNETFLFDALNQAAADIPAERLAGTLVVTDGRIHDVPPQKTDRPFHTLLTGKKNERDRRIVITEVPNYGIVGGRVWVRFVVIDKGLSPGARVGVSVETGDAPPRRIEARVDQPRRIVVPIERAGTIPVRLSVDPVEGDITPVNDKAALTINGVRDRLRVMLLSGQPHAGERTWRDLFKSDPAVDLVHFTILRPPEKTDFTPLKELALIQFPVAELFEKQINNFDLVIFDRFFVRFVVSDARLKTITQFVTEKGGAVMVAAGPDFAGPRSLAATPIGDILPGQPDGRIWEGTMRPQPTDMGRKHPITASLAKTAEVDWGPWLRHIGAKIGRGYSLIESNTGHPLLVVDRVGKGRVALVLSDHIWLWARGYEGGGPHLPLLRGLAHWLMKEPDLEEERLVLAIKGERLQIERHSLKDSLPPAVVTGPDGGQVELDLAQDKNGSFKGQTAASQIGLYKVTQGALSAWAVAGDPNAPEWREVTTSDALLGPLSKASKGGLVWDADQRVPLLRSVAPGAAAAGSGWLGLTANDQYKVVGVSETSLVDTPLAALGGLVLLFALLLGGWLRESRSA